MSEFRLKDKAEVDDVIREAVAELGRSDTPFAYGAVNDETAGGQILYFDLPRVSPLQFNIRTAGAATRRQVVEKISAEVAARLAAD